MYPHVPSERSEENVHISASALEFPDLSKGFISATALCNVGQTPGLM